MRGYLRWPAVLLTAAVSCFGVCSSLWAVEPFVTAKVVFQNPGPYLQADLEAVAGVHPGDRITLDGIKAAAGRLVETQAFANVTMDSRGPAGGMTLIFVLKPRPQADLLPVGFENFVWLTPEELQAAVHRSAPLFGGALPPGSSEGEAIAAGLQAALTAKGVAEATVAFAEVQPTSAQPVHAIQFRVEKPAAVLDRIELTDAGPMSAAVEKLAAKMRGVRYAEGYVPDAADRLLLQPYLDAGYLDARLADRKLSPGANGSGPVRVNLQARVDPGTVYHVSAVRFEPTPMVSGQAFEAGAQLHPGDVASRKRLLDTASAVDALYKRQGYADEYVNTAAVVDAATHTANYNLVVVPGEQYRLHAVTVEGLPPAARAQFDLGWKLKPGDLYNVEYVSAFLGNNTALRGLAGYAGGFQAAADPATHLVDLQLTFFAMTGTR